MPKVYKNINVYEASKKRIKEEILSHDDFYVSFSGGKDSGVLINLVIEVAKEINKLPVKVVMSDLEIIFKETERYSKSIMDKEEVEPYWLCLPELDDNASSVFQRFFKFWSKNEKPWARDMPQMEYVINEDNLPAWFKPYYKADDVNYWSITSFGEALCDKLKVDNIVNFIGLRTDESYGRYMNVVTSKNRDKKNQYTYKYKHKYPRTSICLPIYDWQVEDIWHYYSVNKLDYNRVYDSMNKIGISYSQQRTCSAFGETQKNSLYIWSIIEPETWDRMIDRVQGVNFGKLYNKTRISYGRIKKPENISWREYTYLLLYSLPEEARAIFEEKFMITFRYHKLYYGEKENISFDIYVQDSRKDIKEAIIKYNLPNKVFIAWEDLANAIIKRDFVFKKYGFGYSNKMQNKIDNLYKKYKEV